MPNGVRQLAVEAPLTERRARLAELLAEAPSQLSLCPQTTSGRKASQWLTAWTAMGVEGLVGKDPAGKDTPGRRGWVKAKTKRSSPTWPDYGSNGSGT